MEPVCILLLWVGLKATAAQDAKAPPPNADEFLREGIEAQQRRDFATAIEDYRKALEIRPGLPEARANLGAALSATGQYDQAIEEYQKALPDAPDKIAVHKNLGLAYYKQGDMSHAQQEFTTVHAARPSDLSTSILLGYADVKLEHQAEAVALLTPLEAGNESNMDFEYVLGLALLQAGNDTDGIVRMEKVAQATRSVDAYVMAGSARMRKHEFQEGRADLEAALGLDPSFPGLNSMVGQARDATGDSQGSVAAFEAALKADPRDATANLYLGVIRLKERDFEGARPLLTLALEIRPEDSQARFQLAKLDGMTGKYAEAAKAMEELEKIDPNWLDPHVELATIYYKLHRPEDGQRERDMVQKIEADQQKAGPPK
jgi:tetratricopeptide (TPR) repeat protein